MPELPEVETIKRGVEKVIEQKFITDVSITNRNLRVKIPDYFEQTIQNNKILKTHRRGKYILLDLDNHYSIIIHLGMSGQLTIGKKTHVERKHDHCIFHLSNDKTLIFNDTRRFGLIDLIKTQDLTSSKYFAYMGPEPFTDAFNSDYLHDKFKKRISPIKNLLLDQNIVAGIGNIYACESLYKSQINPFFAANKLNKSELSKIILDIKSILDISIRCGGSSLKDYVNSDGKSGYFQNDFQVYGRYGEKCLLCYTEIDNRKLAGRSTFFCPQCQR